MFDSTPCQPFLDAHPWPLLFVTVSGAHLYGFESADSDYDLRGAHITPLPSLVRLSPPGETYELMDTTGPIEMDVVTHDVKKFFAMLLKNNGYVLEQILSPLVVRAAPEFEELQALAPLTITRNHRHHFFNFGKNQWETVVKSGKPTVKGLLYTYRALLAGIYLMQTGQVQSNLRTLNETYRLSHVNDLIDRKVNGQEYDLLTGEDLSWHEREYHRLCTLLQDARDLSHLPEEPGGRAGLDDLLVRLRLKNC